MSMMMSVKIIGQQLNYAKIGINFTLILCGQLHNQNLTPMYNGMLSLKK